MSLGHRYHGRIVLIGSFVAALFAACAQGNHVEPTGGAASGGAGGEGGGGIPPGQIGGPCDDDTPCEQGECTNVGPNKYCVVPCPPACPDGTYCAIINGDSICVPDLGAQCRPCVTFLQCSNPSDACLTAPAGDKFCARDCTTDGECPNGFTCMEGAKYPPTQGGEVPDAGAGDDAGGGGAGGEGGAGGAGGGAPDAGTTKPPPGQAYKFCVPNVPFSCRCDEKRDGVEKGCSNSNQFGTCVGVETCNGESGNFEGCTAKVPAAEACNVIDDDCDGAIDEGEPNELCSAEGPVPPHASWACSEQGKCELGPCEPGWSAYPPGPIADGCTCPVEMGEPNDLCMNATPAGSVSDTSGSSITITGTLGGAGDVDVWSFDTVDTAEGNVTNSYHVSIDFVSPTPNDEFVIDVIRGDACTDTPAGGGVGITSYDWCVDGKSADGLQGEAPCSNTGAQPTHCNDNSTKYYVRVYRKLGAQGTCTQYSLLVTAAGGDPCDFTQKCQ
ncbi:hypothetical protein [Polyangium spumosum]|uniref:Uncharacterized protein n=1 Tax=Polyangium spumosum TaxID=889282 RepID=A0A6N7PWD8_9BACT|nr:hypothetical protein [Polyangium spumosum]MRG96542.1 hypothetical protein [Polyangium spumosum]